MDYPTSMSVYLTQGVAIFNANGNGNKVHCNILISCRKHIVVSSHKTLNTKWCIKTTMHLPGRAKLLTKALFTCIHSIQPETLFIGYNT